MNKNNKDIRHARTCYDHLAGKLGVQLTESLVKRGFLAEQNNDFELTDAGNSFLSSMDINLQELRKRHRSFSRKCLDWTEKRPHLAGSLGNALLEMFIDLNWVERMPKTRAIKITPKGKNGFAEKFFIDVN